MKNNFNPRIEIGTILNNDELQKIFKVGMSGGIRYSKKNNAIVIVSVNTKEGLYDNRWEGDTFFYTGSGVSGNQQFIRFNKRLRDSIVEQSTVHLFEVSREKEYEYRGQMQLAGTPFFEKQKDEDDNYRDAIIFPLKFIKANSVRTLEDLKKQENISHNNINNKIKHMSGEDLKQKAQMRGTDKPSYQNTKAKHYSRDPYVAEYAKRMANGTCQLCLREAPFKDKKGNPYLESHHIVWLSQGGSDTIDNTIALCPNCHRKMHVIASEKDVQLLKDKAKKFSNKSNN